jgi:hypothetical protein
MMKIVNIISEINRKAIKTNISKKIAGISTPILLRRHSKEKISKFSVGDKFVEVLKKSRKS